jgi:hypothetical protein
MSHRNVLLTPILPLLFAGLPARASTPGNGWVVWASNRKDGRHEIYLMKSDGTQIQRLTFKGAKLPGWSPDAKWIAYENASDSSTHVLRWTGKGDKKVCDGAFKFWMWDGSGLVCRVGDDFYVVNPDTAAKKLLFHKKDFTRLGSHSIHAGGITHDGRWLLGQSDIIKSGYTFDNGTFPKAYGAAVALDFKDKGKIYYIGLGCEPTTPPGGDLIYHVCGNGGGCPNYPDPYRMNMKDIASRSSYKPEITHSDADWGHEYFPRISNDNKWMAYAATTGCHDQDVCDYEIFIHKLGAGDADRTRITTHSANDQWPHLWVGTLPAVECSTAGDCDDGDPCTTDSCSAGKCGSSAISGCCTQDSQCDDGSPCTKDTCSGNACKHEPLAGCCASDSDCADTNPCTVDSCDSATGTCSNKTQKGCCAADTDCDDGDPCTLDSCDGASNTCKHAPACGADGGADGATQTASDAAAVTRGDASSSSDLPTAGGDGGTSGASMTRFLNGGCAMGGRPASAWPVLAVLLLGLWCLRRPTASP